MFVRVFQEQLWRLPIRGTEKGPIHRDPEQRRTSGQFRVARLEIGDQAFAVVRVALEQCVEDAVDFCASARVTPPLAFLELARQPPVPLSSRFTVAGRFHGLGRLLDRQAAEKAQLDEPRLLGVESLELPRRLSGPDRSIAILRRRCLRPG